MFCRVHLDLESSVSVDFDAATRFGSLTLKVFLGDNLRTKRGRWNKVNQVVSTAGDNAAMFSLFVTKRV